MRVRQLRSFDITFEGEEEYLEYVWQAGQPPGYVTRIKIWPTITGAAMIRFEGFFYDIFDVTIVDTSDGVMPAPKKKPFGTECDIAQLHLPLTDPVMKFIDQLNMMRHDEMSMKEFLDSLDPVG